MASLLHTLRHNVLKLKGATIESTESSDLSGKKLAPVVMEYFNFYKRRCYIKTSKQRKAQVRRLRLIGWTFDSAGLFYFVSKGRRKA